MKKMTRQHLPLLFGALAIYILGTAFLYSKTACCSASAAAAAAITDKAVTSTAATTAAAVAVTEAAATNTSGIALVDDYNNFAARADDALTFMPSEFTYLPLSDDLKQVHQEAADYLNANPDRSLTIAGQYMGEEANNSILSSLGLARANQVKNLLLEYGAPESQLIIEEVLVDALPKNSNVFNNVITYGFSDNPGDRVTDLDEMADRLSSTPILLYFDTNAKKLELTTEQRQYFTDLIYYLNKNPQAKITATGHADNEGDANMNKYISRKRSYFVRDYLILNGINENQIRAKNEGQNKPIATNDTEEGRAKNRRVEITLNK